MVRKWLAGGAVIVLLGGAVVLWQRSGPSVAALQLAAPAAAQAAPAGDEPLVAPASDVTPADREAKRFNRSDKDRDGAIARDEYFAGRRKAFARLDVDGDGKLGFDEYSVKALAKFAAADRDRDGELAPVEFATTALKRSPRTKPVCPAVAANDEPAEG